MEPSDTRADGDVFNAPECQVVEVPPALSGLPDVETEFISKTGKTTTFRPFRTGVAAGIFFREVVEASLRMGDVDRTRELVMEALRTRSTVDDPGDAAVALTSALLRDRGAGIDLHVRGVEMDFDDDTLGYCSMNAEGLIHSEAANKGRLEERIRFLEAQLQQERVDLRLFRIGAGGLVAAVVSLTSWWLLGVAVPFHHVFAALALPVSIGVLAMAVLTRPSEE